MGFHDRFYGGTSSHSSGGLRACKLAGILDRGAGFVLALDHSAKYEPANAPCVRATGIAARHAGFGPGGLERVTPEDGPCDAALMLNVAQFRRDRGAFQRVGPVHASP